MYTLISYRDMYNIHVEVIHVYFLCTKGRCYYWRHIAPSSQILWARLAYVQWRVCSPSASVWVWVCGCGCVGVWVWVCGCVGVGVWVCGSMGVCLCVWRQEGRMTAASGHSAAGLPLHVLLIRGLPPRPAHTHTYTRPHTRTHTDSARPHHR